MPQALAYSFDYEPASKFCYDLDQKRLEIHFTRCWEVATQYCHKGPCYLVIHQWSDACCQEDIVGSRAVRLEQGMGIVNLLLSMTWAGEHLEVYVDTIDGRYLMLRFTNPSVEVVL